MRDWKLVLFVMGFFAVCSVSFGQFWYWPNNAFYGYNGYYNSGNCPNGQCNRQNNAAKEDNKEEVTESEQVELEQSEDVKEETVDEDVGIAPVDSVTEQVGEQIAEAEGNELDFELLVSNAELSLINEINKMRTEAGLPRLWIRYPQCKKIRGCCDRINEGEVVPTDGEIECVCFELLTPKQIVEKWCSDLKSKKALLSEEIAEIAVGQSGKCSMVRVW